VPSRPKKQPELLQPVLAGDRRALARAITLIESRAAGDKEVAADLLAAVMPYAGKSLRIGISGPPGVGKSSFIEAFGQKLIVSGKHKVAVLAIDPTSRVSGGSILGDKTRMEELARSDMAFIRPSPGGEAFGGVARQTRESIFLVEAAGHDIVLVETIGVGQSESAVASMVDCFMLLHQPSSGDDLQGIKRGNLELADFVIVTKADGDLLSHARKAQTDLLHALSYFATSSHAAPPVLACSSVTGEGLDAINETLNGWAKNQQASGAFERRRKDQTLDWFRQEVQELLLERFQRDPGARKLMQETEKSVGRGEIPASRAAEQVVDAFIR
jgi:LAO/AO transport system kinase